MKYSDESDERRAANIGYTNERWRQLYGVQNDWSTEGIKYLFLVNAGAAAAMLAFLGSVAESRSWGWPITMLVFFAIGIVLIGFMHALRHHHVSQIFKEWRKSVSEYQTDQKGWSEIISADVARSARFDWALLLAYASFACFIVGIIIGMVNFSTLTGGESNGRKKTDTTTSTAQTISASSAASATGQGGQITAKGRNAEQPTTSTASPKEVK
jgi:hypothetical protein